jgi:hypothetical protein
MDISNKILSEITVYMKYAKYLPNLNRRESWEELVTRNKQMHTKKYPALVDEINAAYEFVYAKKVLPSMRSLQFGGKSIDISPNRIYNCAYLPIDVPLSILETTINKVLEEHNRKNNETKSSKKLRELNCVYTDIEDLLFLKDLENLQKITCFSTKIIEENVKNVKTQLKTNEKYVSKCKK